jgi:hypothetical protein
MAFDLVQIRKLAEKKADENWRFRSFLKGECDLESEEIDRQVFETTRRVWAGIDCTACANCCREVKPSFSEEESTGWRGDWEWNAGSLLSAISKRRKVSAKIPGRREPSLALF